jgi:hypothetical protein
MAFQDPSSTGTFVPSWEATGQLVAFIKDPKKFRFLEYTAFRNALKPVGLYVVFESAQAVRVPTKEEFSWPDGMPRPAGNNNLMGFTHEGYQTERLDIPFTLGNRTRAACPWNIVGMQAIMAMSQYMTLLGWQIVNMLETEANWALRDGVTTNAETAVNLGEGQWDQGSPEFPYMQKGLNAAFQRIFESTYGTVTKEQMRLVLGVEAARKIRTSQEVIEYVKQSPYAMQQIRGEIAGRNTEFDLPDKLFGFEVVVETGMRVSSRKNASGTETKGFIKSPDSAILMAKQETLPGDYVSDAAPIPNFSTMQVFTYIGEGADGQQVTTDGRQTGGMPFTVETFEDTKNRRLDGHVVGDWGLEMVAPEAGYLIKDILE